MSKVYRRVEKVTSRERKEKGWSYKYTEETERFNQGEFRNSFNSNVEGEKRVVYQLRKDNYWVLDT